MKMSAMKSDVDKFIGKGNVCFGLLLNLPNLLEMPFKCIFIGNLLFGYSQFWFIILPKNFLFYQKILLKKDCYLLLFRECYWFLAFLFLEVLRGLSSFRVMFLCYVVLVFWYFHLPKLGMAWVRICVMPSSPSRFSSYRALHHVFSSCRALHHVFSWIILRDMELCLKANLGVFLTQLRQNI